MGNGHEITGEIFLIIFLIILNSFFVIAEVSLLSVRKSRIEELISRKNRLAKIIGKTIENINIYIIATQIGSVITSLGLGWVGQSLSASMAKYIFPSILAFLFLAIIHMIFGELIPKTIAIRYPERLSMIVAIPMQIFIKLFGPLINVLDRISKFILMAVGINPDYNHKNQEYSEKEIKIILNQSTKYKTISEGEKIIATNVFKLKKMDIGKIMIPKKKLVGFTINNRLEEIRNNILKNSLIYNRYPIFNSSKKDKIVGFVHITDIFRNYYNKLDHKKIIETNLIRKITHIREISRADEVILKMKKERVYVSVVVNNEGRTIGLISLTDITQNLL